MSSSSPSLVTYVSTVWADSFSLCQFSARKQGCWFMLVYLKCVDQVHSSCMLSCGCNDNSQEYARLARAVHTTLPVIGGLLGPWVASSFLVAI